MGFKLSTRSRQIWCSTGRMYGLSYIYIQSNSYSTCVTVPRDMLTNFVWQPRNSLETKRSLPVQDAVAPLAPVAAPRALLTRASSWSGVPSSTFEHTRPLPLHPATDAIGTCGIMVAKRAVDAILPAVPCTPPTKTMRYKQPSTKLSSAPSAGALSAVLATLRAQSRTRNPPRAASPPAPHAASPPPPAVCDSPLTRPQQASISHSAVKAHRPRPRPLCQGAGGAAVPPIPSTPPPALHERISLPRGLPPSPPLSKRAPPDPWCIPTGPWSLEEEATLRSLVVERTKATERNGANTEQAESAGPARRGSGPARRGSGPAQVGSLESASATEIVREPVCILDEHAWVELSALLAARSGGTRRDPSAVARRWRVLNPRRTFRERERRAEVPRRAAATRTAFGGDVGEGSLRWWAQRRKQEPETPRRRVLPDEHTSAIETRATEAPMTEAPMTETPMTETPMTIDLTASEGSERSTQTRAPGEVDTEVVDTDTETEVDAQGEARGSPGPPAAAPPRALPSEFCQVPVASDEAPSGRESTRCSPVSSRGAPPPPLHNLESMLCVDLHHLVAHMLSHRLNPYRCAGLSQRERLPQAELRKRYLQLARRLHPDKNHHPQAQEAFNVMCESFRQVSRIGDASDFFKQTFAESFGT